MEISGKLAEEDLDDLAILLRTRRDWFSLLLQILQPAAVLAFIVWGTILAILGKTTPQWRALAAIWAVIGAITVWAIWSAKRERTSDLTKLNDTLPDLFRLSSEGIRWRTAEGQRDIRWNDFGGWREQPRLIALDDLRGATAVVLPLAGLTEFDRQRLRDLLTSQIPPPSANRQLTTAAPDRRNALARETADR